MAARYYLVPLEFSADGGFRLLKYFFHRFDPNPPALIPRPAGVAVRQLDYGMEQVALVDTDLPAEHHTLLAAQSDVVVIPENVQTTLGGARAQLEAQLEALSIPAEWMTGAMTYFRVLQGIVGVFKVSQTLYEKGYLQLRPVGVTANTPYSSMPSPYREDLLASIDQWGYDRSGTSTASTWRQLMAVISAQPGNEPFLVR